MSKTLKASIALVTLICLSVITLRYLGESNDLAKGKTVRTAKKALKKVEPRLKRQVASSEKSSYGAHYQAGFLYKYKVTTSGEVLQAGDSKKINDYVSYVYILHASNASSNLTYSFVGESLSLTPDIDFSNAGIEALYIPGNGLSKIREFGEFKKDGFRERKIKRDLITYFYYPSCLKGVQRVTVKDTSGTKSVICDKPVISAKKKTSSYSFVQTTKDEDKNEIFVSNKATMVQSLSSSEILSMNIHETYKYQQTEATKWQKIEFIGKTQYKLALKRSVIKSVPLYALDHFPTIKEKIRESAFIELLAKGNIQKASFHINDDPRFVQYIIDKLAKGEIGPKELDLFLLLANSNDERAQTFLLRQFQSDQPIRKEAARRTLNFSNGEITPEIEAAFVADYSKTEGFDLDKINTGMALGSFHSKSASDEIETLFKEEWEKNTDIGIRIHLLSMMGNTRSGKFDSHYESIIKKGDILLVNKVSEILSLRSDIKSATLLEQVTAKESLDIKIAGYQAISDRTDKDRFVDLLKKCRLIESLKDYCQ